VVVNRDVGKEHPRAARKGVKSETFVDASYVENDLLTIVIVVRIFCRSILTVGKE
jgi:hypothetical protein